MQLSDLLEAARADAPPARYDVDHVVRAGRRLRRRRRTAWVAGVALAVAAVIGVPQWLHGPDRRSAPVVQPGPVVPSLVPFDYTFTGYRAGRFTVTDPLSLSLGWMFAKITDDGSKKPGCAVMCHLSIGLPGAPLPAGITGERITAEPINGRPAYFLADKGGIRYLIWDYADGAYAHVQAPVPLAMTKAEMRQIAEGFRPGAARAAHLGFRMTYVPADYRLTNVTTPAGSPSARFEVAEVAEARMTAPTRVPPESLRTSHATLLISVIPFHKTDGSGPTTPECTTPKIDGPSCRMFVGDGRTMVNVMTTDATTLPVAELRRTLEGITVLDQDQPGTWPRVNDAIPAAAQLTVNR
ncbi:hypothetical protein [Actinoplanes palleronii]|uniref:Uncharacterized protein n=1 Tax=Actinoplanes palleronii TaxID=113570 RepID=A0ABQ4BB64_9ACTN|nr:hypothetical protein [Actinoplanes palleronii]GIE67631.1 hypothetical protein Apa02nite_037390 [Actinoplanes palleronii]